jgi:hypothetical protein
MPSPIQTNTQIGLITKPSAADLTASIGCFATVNTSAQAALPSANALALYVIADAYDSGGVHNTVLQPLDSNRNVRIIAGGTITAADQITTTSAGKAVTASTGNVILGIAEEAGLNGQWVTIRPIGGKTVA